MGQDWVILMWLELIWIYQFVRHPTPPTRKLAVTQTLQLFCLNCRRRTVASDKLTAASTQAPAASLKSHPSVSFSCFIFACGRLTLYFFTNTVCYWDLISLPAQHSGSSSLKHDSVIGQKARARCFLGNSMATVAHAGWVKRQ